MGEALMEAALAYAARGWAVCPCDPRPKERGRPDASKRPLLPKDVDADGKPIRGSGGLKKASTVPALIRGWWGRWPDAMIGLPMGGQTGAFVLDFDPRTDAETGEEWTLERLKAEVEAQIGCALPPSVAARTPSGGVHLWLAQPEGEPIRNRGNLPPHVDVRGDGGYVIVPPSPRSADGVGYRWLKGRAPGEVPLAVAPERLIEVLRRPAEAKPPVPREEACPAPPRRDPGDAGDRVRKYGLSALDRACEELAKAGEGTRNNAIFDAALKIGSLVSGGALREGVARAALEEVCRAWPDFEKSKATVDNGLATGMRNPRDMAEVAAKGPLPREDGARPARRGGAAAVQQPRAEPPPKAASTPPDAAPSPPPCPAPRDDGGTGKSSHSGGRGAQPPENGGAGADEAGAYLAQTDLGNAERFRLRHGEAFRWCEALGWLAWDGRRWSRDGADTAVATAVYETVRAILDEADWLAERGRAWEEAFGDGSEPDGPHPDPYVDIKKGTRRSDKLRSWARSSESAQRLGCIARLAQPWLAVETAALDRDPLLINLGNGTLVLRRVEANGFVHAEVELRPHAREDLITRMMPVDYLPGAECPIYDGFLARVQPEATMRRFLHAWAGYSLTGNTAEQKLVFNYGTGGNGKSLWLDTVAKLAGDYAMTVPIETFLAGAGPRKGSDASPDLAELAGRRLVRASEPEKGSKLADALIKAATGGEPMLVRHLNKPFFELQPEFKITITGNYRPTVNTDEGIWRRLQLVPWGVSIPEAERDNALGAKLLVEASGILNRLIAGAIDWLGGGLPVPEGVREATAEYREASDPLGRFLALCVARKVGARAQSTALYETFVAWCKWAGEKEWTQVGLSKAMEDRGFRKKKSDTIQWIDAELMKAAHEFVDPMTGKVVEQSAPFVGQPSQTDADGWDREP